MAKTIWRDDVRALRPMLATLVQTDAAPLTVKGWFFERKYDGIRAIGAAVPGGKAMLFSRAGNEKTGQFPELAAALDALARSHDRPLVLDGEIVSVGAHGELLGFEALQPRMHLTHVDRERTRQEPAVYVVFDLLRDGDEDLRPQMFTERRQRLTTLLSVPPGGLIQLASCVPAPGTALLDQAREEAWEGVIAKAGDSVYTSGRRSTQWLKVKVTARDEFVIGGWTEPRGSRAGLGALLIGEWQGNELRYVGHVGTGFTQKTLAALAAQLAPLETDRCPFHVRPVANQRAHWVKPTLVVDVRFAERTKVGVLRAPVFLGVKPETPAHAIRDDRVAAPDLDRPNTAKARQRSADTAGRATDVPGVRAKVAPLAGLSTLESLAATLAELEQTRGQGRLLLGPGHTVDVSNLRKLYWPALGITKGELLRYYLQIAPALLPVVADRPLVMRRFPDGVDGKAFYQQRAPDKVPAGVRVEEVADDEGTERRLVGGDPATLLFMVQLGVFSQDPWFSRVDSSDDVDQIAFDLDPMPDVPFGHVVDVALWVRDELDRLGLRGFVKTSGATGMHIFVPLKSGTSYPAGRLFAQIVATLIARRHPKVATVERSVGARGKTVYIDYLQNIRGKTLACAYSARASEYAGASAPLTWDEVNHHLDPRAFTMRTLPQRLAELGDLWADLRNPQHFVDLRTVLDRLAQPPPKSVEPSAELSAARSAVKPKTRKRASARKPV